MEMALEFALKGRGTTSPNPMVGCIIVKRGRIVGKGWHKKAGEPHAEVGALREAGKKAKDSILYITNQPCIICAKMIINAGIKEIVVKGDYPDRMSMDFLREAKIRIRALSAKK